MMATFPRGYGNRAASICKPFADSGTVLALTNVMIISRIGRRSAFTGIALALAMLSSTGCGKDAAAPPANPQIAGHWSGSAALSTVRFEATFTESAGAVGGSGQFTSPLGSGPFTVDGRVTGGDVSLNLTSTQFGVTTYVGRFSGDNRIIGHLTDASYGNIDLTLDRD